MSAANAHPSQRFLAPSAIERGVPLKALMDSRLVGLIAESLEGVVPGFEGKRFRARGARGLEQLELKERAAHIARAMAEALPESFDEAGPLLVASLGPTLTATEGNGLAPFFYFPHSHLIAMSGLASFDSGMAANYELTKRFTAEFSIRPFLIARREKSLAILKRWAKDDSAHVRRLVSEGTRPRLPWAMRLPEFQADPTLSLPLLELLKDDPVLYVRRSVANHVGDLAKDNLDFALGLCETWLEEVGSDDSDRAENRRWIVRHAVRHPAKMENAKALQLRRKAAAVPRRSIRSAP